MHIASRLLALALLGALPGLLLAQESFPTPEAAADAFIAALGTEKADPERLAALLGNDWHNYIPTEGIDRDEVDAFLAHYRDKHEIHKDNARRAHLVVGNDPWTLPLPIEQEKKGWAFNAKAGGEEIRIRRIGRNEESTLEAVQAYHDAQMDFAEVDRNGDGILEYAQKFVSSDGYHDGLYWPEEEGGEESPLGPLFGDELPGDGWHGYHYRILTAQGPSAPGGAYDYKIGGRMTRGFALIAWPVKYGDSGVMSFMISHDGEIFSKNLGPESGKIAMKMSRFDPDSSWTEVTAQEEKP
ncbi:DUF2950 domain-containing protein [Pseudomonas nitroreducens]|uniref:DUF2950 domain-containing protein n=1 Tax=Pseudomonas nitroreducens TaxID=46680 RepID=UPI0009FF16E5|nr:DUF2950 domain-containing protein [Pseudomonas nitroreducens]NMZ62446.1 DUF2950 domain-containing protein [Pseudomonas nitroreducens]SNT39614.1 Protein of unknown function [Pseudomonas nitroreducens]